MIASDICPTFGSLSQKLLFSFHRQCLSSDPVYCFYRLTIHCVYHLSRPLSQKLLEQRYVSVDEAPGIVRLGDRSLLPADLCEGLSPAFPSSGLRASLELQTGEAKEAAETAAAATVPSSKPSAPSSPSKSASSSPSPSLGLLRTAAALAGGHSGTSGAGSGSFTSANGASSNFDPLSYSGGAAGGLATVSMAAWIAAAAGAHLAADVVYHYTPAP
jgi:hypothetical protein